MEQAPASGIEQAPQGEPAPEPRKKWPELVGKTGEEAKQEILKTGGAGLTKVIILPEDSMYTEDYREDRVRIFVDASGKVVRPPMVG